MSVLGTKHYCRLVLMTTAFGLICAAQASAAVIVAQTAVGNVIITLPITTAFVPGVTTGPFAFGPGQRFIVTFTAECAVNAPAGNTTAWTDVDLQVYDASNALVVTLSPTSGNADAFCSADGSAGLSGWRSSSVTAVGPSNLAPGVYRIAVRARLNNGATQASYGERSIVVYR